MTYPDNIPVKERCPYCRDRLAYCFFRLSAVMLAPAPNRLAKFSPWEGRE